MREKVCIYHKNCFDGICSAWVVNKRYPNIELIPMSYSDPIDEFFFRAKDVIFVDFSLKRHVMITIANQSRSLLILDHHQTAKKELEGLQFVRFDMNESGASLAWKFFFPNQPIPLLVQYIRDRDLWEFELEDSETINSYIQSYPMEIEYYEMLHTKLEYNLGIAEARSCGESILRYKNTMVRAMCNSHHMKDVGGHTVPVVNASILFSEVGNELCKQFPGAPFAAYYFDRLLDNVRQWGLRSIGDFDVSVVAKQLGGGGHKNAAGFEQRLNEL